MLERPEAPSPYDLLPKVPGFRLESNDIKEGERLPNEHVSDWVTELPRGGGKPSGEGLPSGALQLRNDGGGTGYMGAAPPKGDKPHRYIFAVHALATDKLDVQAGASPAVLGFNITFHIVARATLTAIYQVE